MSQTIEAPIEVGRPDPGEDFDHERPWVVIVWNDPINLMSYVTLVLQQLFGYSETKATRLMLQVHHEGKAAVSSGKREKAEFDVSRLHAHGLWATMQQDCWSAAASRRRGRVQAAAPLEEREFLRSRPPSCAMSLQTDDPGLRRSFLRPIPTTTRQRGVPTARRERSSWRGSSRRSTSSSAPLTRSR